MTSLATSRASWNFDTSLGQPSSNNLSLSCQLSFTSSLYSQMGLAPSIRHRFSAMSAQQSKVFSRRPTWITQDPGTLRSEGGAAVTVDPLGNVYVVGYTEGELARSKAGALYLNNDPFIVKYNSNGRMLWKRQFGDLNLQDGANAVASDSKGNIYVAGYSYATSSQSGGKGGLSDAFLAKYRSNGTCAWLKKFGSAKIDSAKGVAVDARGNIYVVGAINGNYGIPQGDAFLKRFNSNGQELWTRRLSTPADDVATSVTVDSRGHVCVTGSTQGSLGGANQGFYDTFIARYTPSGNRNLLRQWGTSGFDESRGIAVDRAGNIYLTGSTPGSQFGFIQDAFVLKYTRNGSISWNRVYDTPSADDSANAITFNRNGELYITGQTNGTFAQPGAGGFDVFVAAIDTAGNWLYQRQVGSSANDIGNGIAIDRRGANLFITGWTLGTLGSRSNGYNDLFLAKYSA